APTKQLVAIVAGGIAGAMCLVGLVLLIHRRLSDARVLANSKPMDIVILFWILATLLVGLTSIWFSLGHKDGNVMLLLMDWAQHIATFRGGASTFVLGVPLIYKVHLFF